MSNTSRNSQRKDKDLENVVQQKKQLEPLDNRWAFMLVLLMLVILFALIFSLVRIIGTSVIALSQPSDSNVTPKDLIEFGKWTVTALIGAFGAWIGAGAAYFFGRENLAESSRSTEAALNIQRDMLHSATKRDRIKDLALTTMNSTFNFTPKTIVDEVVKELGNHADYWWIPVLDQEGNGTLYEVIHARVFWDDQVKAKTIAELIELLNQKAQEKSDKDYGKLHGASFFITVTLDESIAAAASKMKKSGAVVGVVVDEKGRPTHCFTKQNLQVAQS